MEEILKVVIRRKTNLCGVRKMMGEIKGCEWFSPADLPERGADVLVLLLSRVRIRVGDVVFHQHIFNEYRNRHV